MVVVWGHHRHQRLSPISLDFSLKAEHAMRSYLPQLTKTGTSTNWYMHAGQQLAYNIHKHECIPILWNYCDHIIGMCSTLKKTSLTIIIVNALLLWAQYTHTYSTRLGWIWSGQQGGSMREYCMHTSQIYSFPEKSTYFWSNIAIIACGVGIYSHNQQLVMW